MRRTGAILIHDPYDTSANGSMDATYYHLTDNQFSTVAILDTPADCVFGIVTRDENVTVPPAGSDFRSISPTSL